MCRFSHSVGITAAQLVFSQIRIASSEFSFTVIK